MLLVDALIKELNYLLSFHAMTTRNLSRANLNDQAVLTEGLFAQMANILFDLSLKNANAQKANADTIDLQDSKLRVAVQVTIREDRDKIDSAIAKFIEKKYYQDFDKLYFFILGTKPKYSKGFDLRGKIVFDQAEHILSIPELVRLASCLPLPKLEQLVGEVKKYISIPSSAVISKTEQIDRLWLTTTLLQVNVLRAVTPDFLGRKLMSPPLFYSLASESLDQLEKQTNLLPLSVSPAARISIKNFINQCYIVLNAVRIFKDKFDPRDEGKSKYWFDACQAQKNLDLEVAKFEVLLQSERT